MSGIIIDTSVTGDSGSQNKLRGLQKSLERIKNTADLSSSAVNKTFDGTATSALKASRGVKTAAFSLRDFSVNVDKSFKNLSMSTAKSNKDLASLNNTVKSTTGLFKGLLAAVAGGAIAAGFSKLSDSLTSTQNSLKAVTDTSREAIKVQRELRDISLETATVLGDNARLFKTFKESTKFSDSDIKKIVKTIGLAGTVSSSDAASVQAAVRQLIQGVQSNRFGGEEFNSVSEQLPEILKLLRADLKVTQGELRKLAEEGRLTADTLGSALINQSSILEQQLGKSQLVISKASSIFADVLKESTANILNFTGVPGLISRNLVANAKSLSKGTEATLLSLTEFKSKSNAVFSDFDKLDFFNFGAKESFELYVAELEAQSSALGSTIDRIGVNISNSNKGFEELSLGTGLKVALVQGFNVANTALITSSDDFINTISKQNAAIRLAYVTALKIGLTSSDFQAVFEESQKGLNVIRQVDLGRFFDVGNLNSIGDAVRSVGKTIFDLGRIVYNLGQGVAITLNQISDLIPTVQLFRVDNAAVRLSKQQLNQIKENFVKTSVSIRRGFFEPLTERISLFKAGDNEAARAFVNVFKSDNLSEFADNLDALNESRQETRLKDNGFLIAKLRSAAISAVAPLFDLGVEIGLIENRLIKVVDGKGPQFVEFINRIGVAIKRFYTDIIQPNAIARKADLTRFAEDFASSFADAFVNSVTGKVNLFEDAAVTLFNGFFDRFKEAASPQRFKSLFTEIVTTTPNNYIELLLRKAFQKPASPEFVESASLIIEDSVSAIKDKFTAAFESIGVFNFAEAVTSRAVTKDFFGFELSFTEKFALTFRNMWQDIKQYSATGIQFVQKQISSFNAFVNEAFFDIYDKVVGNSYWPDMIDGVIADTDRLFAAEDKVNSFADRVSAIFEDLSEVELFKKISEGFSEFSIKVKSIDIEEAISVALNNSFAIISGLVALAFGSGIVKAAGLANLAFVFNDVLDGALTNFGPALAEITAQGFGTFVTNAVKGILAGTDLLIGALPSILTGFVEGLFGTTFAEFSSVIDELTGVLAVLGGGPAVLAVSAFNSELLQTAAIVTGLSAAFSQDFRKSLTSFLFGKSAVAGKGGKQGKEAEAGILTGFGIKAPGKDSGARTIGLATAALSAYAAFAFDSVGAIESTIFTILGLRLALKGKDSFIKDFGNIASVIEGLRNSFLNIFRNLRSFDTSKVFGLIDNLNFVPKTALAGNVENSLKGLSDTGTSLVDNTIKGLIVAFDTGIRAFNRAAVVGGTVLKTVFTGLAALLRTQIGRVGLVIGLAFGAFSDAFAAGSVTEEIGNLGTAITDLLLAIVGGISLVGTAALLLKTSTSGIVVNKAFKDFDKAESPAQKRAVAFNLSSKINPRDPLQNIEKVEKLLNEGNRAFSVLKIALLTYFAPLRNIAKNINIVAGKSFDTRNLGEDVAARLNKTLFRGISNRDGSSKFSGFDAGRTITRQFGNTSNAFAAVKNVEANNAFEKLTKSVKALTVAMFVLTSGVLKAGSALVFGLVASIAGALKSLVTSLFTQTLKTKPLQSGDRFTRPDDLPRNIKDRAAVAEGLNSRGLVPDNTAFQSFKLRAESIKESLRADKDVEATVNKAQSRLGRFATGTTKAVLGPIKLATVGVANLVESIVGIPSKLTLAVGGLGLLYTIFFGNGTIFEKVQQLFDKLLGIVGLDPVTDATKKFALIATLDKDFTAFRSFNNDPNAFRNPQDAIAKANASKTTFNGSALLRGIDFDKLTSKERDRSTKLFTKLTTELDELQQANFENNGLSDDQFLRFNELITQIKRVADRLPQKELTDKDIEDAARQNIRRRQQSLALDAPIGAPEVSDTFAKGVGASLLGIGVLIAAKLKLVSAGIAIAGGVLVAKILLIGSLIAAVVVGIGALFGGFKSEITTATNFVLDSFDFIGNSFSRFGRELSTAFGELFPAFAKKQTPLEKDLIGARRLDLPQTQSTLKQLPANERIAYVEAIEQLKDLESNVINITETLGDNLSDLPEAFKNIENANLDQLRSLAARVGSNDETFGINLSKLDEDTAKLLLQFKSTINTYDQESAKLSGEARKLIVEAPNRFLLKRNEAQRERVGKSLKDAGVTIDETSLRNLSQSTAALIDSKLQQRSALIENLGTALKNLEGKDVDGSRTEKARGDASAAEISRKVFAEQTALLIKGLDGAVEVLQNAGLDIAADKEFLKSLSNDNLNALINTAANLTAATAARDATAGFSAPEGVETTAQVEEKRRVAAINQLAGILRKNSNENLLKRIQVDLGIEGNFTVDEAFLISKFKTDLKSEDPLVKARNDISTAASVKDKLASNVAELAGKGNVAGARDLLLKNGIVPTIDNSKSPGANLKLDAIQLKRDAASSRITGGVGTQEDFAALQRANLEEESLNIRTTGTDLLNLAQQVSGISEDTLIQLKQPLLSSVKELKAIIGIDRQLEKGVSFESAIELKRQREALAEKVASDLRESQSGLRVNAFARLRDIGVTDEIFKTLDDATAENLLQYQDQLSKFEIAIKKESLGSATFNKLKQGIVSTKEKIEDTLDFAGTSIIDALESLISAAGLESSADDLLRAKLGDIGARGKELADQLKKARKAGDADSFIAAETALKDFTIGTDLSSQTRNIGKTIRDRGRFTATSDAFSNFGLSSPLRGQADAGAEELTLLSTISRALEQGLPKSTVDELTEALSVNDFNKVIAATGNIPEATSENPIVRDNTDALRLVSLRIGKLANVVDDETLLLDNNIPDEINPSAREDILKLLREQRQNSIDRSLGLKESSPKANKQLERKTDFALEGDRFSKNFIGSFREASANLFKGIREEGQSAFVSFRDSILTAFTGGVVDTTINALLNPLTGEDGILQASLRQLGNSISNTFSQLADEFLKSDFAKRVGSFFKEILNSILTSLQEGTAVESIAGFFKDILSSLKTALLGDDTGADLTEGLASLGKSLLGGTEEPELLNSFATDNIGDSIGESLESSGLFESLSGSFDGLLGGFKSLFSGFDFGSLFGGGGGGGSLFSSALSAASLAFGGGFATGGLIRGPGTGTSDSILARVSNKEFVVNAASTSRFLPLLQQINSGNIPAFADGGLVSDSSAFVAPAEISGQTMGVQAQTGNQEININITGDISRQTRAEIYNMLPSIATGVNMYNREKGVR